MGGPRPDFQLVVFAGLCVFFSPRPCLCVSPFPMQEHHFCNITKNRKKGEKLQKRRSKKAPASFISPDPRPSVFLPREFLSFFSGWSVKCFIRAECHLRGQWFAKPAGPRFEGLKNSGRFLDQKMVAEGEGVLCVVVCWFPLLQKS